MSATVVDFHVKVAAVEESLGPNFHYTGESLVNDSRGDVAKIRLYKMNAGPDSVIALIGCKNDEIAVGVAVDFFRGSHRVDTIGVSAREFIQHPLRLTLQIT